MSLKNKAIMIWCILLVSSVIIKHLIFDLIQFDIYPLIIGALSSIAVQQWYDKHKLKIQKSERVTE